MTVPSIALLTQMGAGYSPVAPGLTPRMQTGLEGVPLLGGQGTLSLMANLGLAPHFQRMMGQTGMMPMGVGHDQNLYDVMRNMQFQQMQVQAMQTASQSDRMNFMRSFQGLAAVTGTPFGAEQRAAAGSLSNMMVAAAPILAQTMPEFVDQMGGTRGSASVMANRFMQAGRYRLDPATGRMGLDPMTAGRMASTIYDDLYSDANVGNMQGVSAGQMGSMFQELQSRGMLATGSSMGISRRGATFDALSSLSRTHFGQLTSAASAVGVDVSRGMGNLSGEQLDKLAATPEVSDRMRGFDVQRVKRSLEAYKGAVSAMRDIFGDAGQPNAPMQAIFQGLEALTLGQSHQLDPSKMSMMVRETYALARNTGMSMDGVMMLQQHAAGRAQSLGLPSVFALDARYGGMAYGGAFRGMGMGAHGGWNMMTADQMMQADTNLRLQGAASNVANRLNVVMRVADTMGFEADSDAGRLAAAIRSGQDEFVDAAGKTRSVAMSDTGVMSMLKGAKGVNGQALNLSENDVREFLTQRTTNLQYGNRYNIGDVVRGRPQREERQADIARGVSDTLRYRVRERLVANGMAPVAADERAREIASGVSGRVTERMMGLSAEAFADTGMRDTAVGEIMREELQSGGYGDALKGEGVDEFLRGSATSAYGRSEENLKRFGTSMQNVRALYDPTILNTASQSRWQARHDADMRQKLSSLGGPHTFLSRIVDAMQGADPNDPEAGTRMAMSALGGVGRKDIADALQGRLKGLAGQKQAMDAKLQQISEATDPKIKAKLMSELDQMRGMYGGAIDDIKRMSDQFGINDATLTKEDTTRTVGAIDRVTTSHDADLTMPVAEREKRFGAFWQSTEGLAFRRDVGLAGGQVDDVIDKLTTSPTLIKKFGSEALGMADTLSTNQMRLRELAGLYTGGDLSRLYAKDFNIDTTTDDGKKLYASVQSELAGITAGNKNILGRLGERASVEGRSFDPATEASRILGKATGPEFDALTSALATAKSLTIDDEIMLKQQREWDSALSPEGKKNVKGYGENEARINALTQRMGVGREALMRSSDALGELHEQQKLAEAGYTRPADELLRDVYTSFGLGDKLGADPAAFNQTQMRMMGMLGNTEGRRFASQLIGTQEMLKGAASAGGYFSAEKDAAAGLNSMTVDYTALYGADGTMDAGKAAAFQKKIGIDAATPEGARQWSSFQRSMQWRQNLSSGKAGKDGRVLSDDDVLDVFTGGTSGGAHGAAASKTVPISGHLTGTFEIKGSQVNMTAVAGGSRSFTVPVA